MLRWPWTGPGEGDHSVESCDTEPGHTNAEGNEMADIRAKETARSEWVGRNDHHLVVTINLAHLRRKITERTVRGTKEQADPRTGERRQYLPLENPSSEATCGENGRQ